MRNKNTEIERLWLASGPAMQRMRLFHGTLESKYAPEGIEQESSHPRRNKGDGGVLREASNNDS